MKLLKVCPILAGIVVVTIALSLVSFVLEGSTYSSYQGEVDYSKVPHFALVFKGASEGIYPWSRVENEAEDMMASADVTVEVATDEGAWEISDSNEETSLDISGNAALELSDVSANDISGNSVSDNDADRTYELVPVTEEYFDDALFIGDSRTVGLSEYCKPLDERATFYAKVSLTIYGVMTKEFVKSGDNKISVEQALSENQFGKIYIMLGLNEIGTGTAETFAEEYSKVIDRIRELQPDALIFIQGIMHVSEKKSSSDKYFNNEKINERNEALSQLADNKTIFYIDMNEAVDDENGNLIKDLSFDDVHLKASSYERWYNYLLEHGIIKD
ncbi:GDSL-type esterase/lipase family protein [Butyrivibrio sp. YAB3001]|uniref:GDSL-type esterase/lipase family protein n=1 Tax=Butyrivibrio sp. YAB3001 TaxID=1520812 RepID=UPI0008F622C3|nr:GDSL-type esterase/lipase family protein [Butyrivibrio sp. YAB3001]SFC61346.1 Lysophospholipase L1 [Butyrivibrio sp. YAB3001]